MPRFACRTAEYPQGRDLQVDTLPPAAANPVAYLLDCLENDLPISGPLSIEISRIGQQIVDTAFRSAQEKRTLPLVD